VIIVARRSVGNGQRRPGAFAAGGQSPGRRAWA